MFVNCYIHCREMGRYWQLRGCHKADISYHVVLGPLACCLVWLFVLKHNSMEKSVLRGGWSPRWRMDSSVDNCPLHHPGHL